MAITHSTIPVTEDTSGTLRGVDTVTLAGTERRQVFCVGEPDSAGTDAIARARNVEPNQNNYGLVVRPVLDGTSLGHRLLTASINAVTIAAAPARLFSIRVWNNSSAVFFVKLYDKASIPTPATDTGVLKFVFGVQAGTYRDVVFTARGAGFATGIAYAVVTGIADADIGAVAASAGTVDWEWVTNP